MMKRSPFLALPVMNPLRSGLLPVILSFFMACLSCNKDKGEQSTPLSCRIITALGGPDTYHFTYDAQGRLSTLLIAPTKQKLTYTYEGNTTTVLIEVDGDFQSKFIITNNSRGFATNMRRLANEAGTVWNNQTVEYNGTQIAKILYTTSNPNSPVIAVKYTWKDGNVATLESDNGIISFEYYTDKPVVAGEWRKFNELIEGYRLYDNKNCTKSAKTANEVTTFTYDFDDAGKIVKMTSTETDNGASSVQYEYACN